MGKSKGEKEKDTPDSISKYLLRSSTSAIESENTGAIGAANMADNPSKEGSTSENRSGITELAIEQTSTQVSNPTTNNQSANSDTHADQPTEPQQSSERDRELSRGDTESKLLSVLKVLETKIDSIDKTTKEMKSTFEKRFEALEASVLVNNKKSDDLEQSVNYAHRELEDQKEKVV